MSEPITMERTAASGSEVGDSRRPGPGTLTTDRLVARPLGPGDEPLLAEILQDEQASATLGGVRTDDEVRELLRRMLWHRETFGFGVWIFSDRETGRFAGYGGLLRTRAGGMPDVEVMYSVAPRFWGRGLATEMASALVGRAFEQLGLEELVSYAVPENLPSRRVMEKLGMVYEREITYAREPHVLYRLSPSAG